MQQALPWILASFAVALLAGAGMLWLFSRRRAAVKPLPTEWGLAARPVFNSDERRVYRQLREALPHHIVLSKLPMVRFCQPTDPNEVRFWYELLGIIHVTFAICSANGRVLAAIDLDTDRANSRRVQQIKQSVLGACRVRYLRCPADHLPSSPELQLLVPQSSAATRGPQPAPAMPAGRGDNYSGAAPPRKRERTTLWQDSGFFQDSFFGVDGRGDSVMPSEFSPPRRGSSAREGAAGEAGGPAFDQPMRH